MNTKLSMKKEITEAAIKGDALFVQKVTFELLMDFKQNHYGSWRYHKSWYFQKFSSLYL